MLKCAIDNTLSFLPLIMRHIIYLVLGLFALISCTNQSLSDKKALRSLEESNSGIENVNITKCFKRDLKISISNSFHDTSLIFRKSISPDTTLMIICDTNQINYKLEKVILQSKYLPDFHIKGYYSFLSCLNTYDNIKELGFFYVNITSAEAVEIRRFRIKDSVINGLILLPGIVNEFMSTEEYDSIEKIPDKL